MATKSRHPMNYYEFFYQGYQLCGLHLQNICSYILYYLKTEPLILKNWATYSSKVWLLIYLPLYHCTIQFFIIKLDFVASNSNLLRIFSNVSSFISKWNVLKKVLVFHYKCKIRDWIKWICYNSNGKFGIC